MVVLNGIIGAIWQGIAKGRLPLRMLEVIVDAL